MAAPARKRSPPVALPRPDEATRAAPYATEEDDPLFLSLLLVTSLAAAVFIGMVQTVVLPADTGAVIRAKSLVDDLPQLELTRPPVVSASVSLLASTPTTRPARTPPAQPVSDPVAASGPRAASGVLTARIDAIRQAGERFSALGSAGDVLIDVAGKTTMQDGPAGAGVGFAQSTTAAAEPGPVAVARAGGGVVQTQGVGRVEVQRRVQVVPPPADRPVVEGVAAVVRSYRSGMETCVESALRLDPGLAGRVTLTWTIARGRVQAADVFESSGNVELDRCLTRVVSKMKFPVEISGDIEGYTVIVSGR